MRSTKIQRTTGETKISIELNIDGKGKSSIDTGIGFLDHMLTLFAKHSLMDLDIKCEGDTYVDCHHSVEDIGLTLGKAIDDALGDKSGITRYGTFFLPMDEALVLTTLDLSGRPYLVYDATLQTQRLGDFDTEMAEDFFQAIANSAKMTLQIKQMYGRNTHHIIEAMFKGFGRAMDIATSLDDRVEGIPSTKGVL